MEAPPRAMQCGEPASRRQACSRVSLFTPFHYEITLQASYLTGALLRSSAAQYRRFAKKRRTVGPWLSSIAFNIRDEHTSRQGPCPRPRCERPRLKKDDQHHRSEFLTRGNSNCR